MLIIHNTHSICVKAWAQSNYIYTVNILTVDLCITINVDNIFVNNVESNHLTFELDDLLMNMEQDFIKNFINDVFREGILFYHNILENISLSS